MGFARRHLVPWVRVHLALAVSTRLLVCRYLLRGEGRETWRYKCYYCDNGAGSSQSIARPVCQDHGYTMTQIAPAPRWLYACRCGRLAGFSQQPDFTPVCHVHQITMEPA